MHDIQMFLKIAALLALMYLAVFGKRHGWE